MTLYWAKLAAAHLSKMPDPEYRVELRYIFEEHADTMEREGWARDTAERLAYEHLLECFFIEE